MLLKFETSYSAPEGRPSTTPFEAWSSRAVSSLTAHEPNGDQDQDSPKRKAGRAAGLHQGGGRENVRLTESVQSSRLYTVHVIIAKRPSRIRASNSVRLTPKSAPMCSKQFETLPKSRPGDVYFQVHKTNLHIPMGCSYP
jgi:hypothetical protein